MTKLVGGAVAALTVFLFAISQPANAACTQITTAAGLQAIQSNLNGNYCLANDIDLSSIANFVPVGNEATPFTGNFDGANHIISNLTVNNAGSRVGLFGEMSGGTVKNLMLANANVRATANIARAGTVVGYGNGTTIRNVHADGSVRCTQTCEAGGIAGRATHLDRSSSAATVKVANGSYAGGAVGALTGPVTVQTSFTTGHVTCGDGSICGGFAGNVTGTFRRSYSSGNVSCGGGGFCGGFAGGLDSGSDFQDIYATGNIIRTGGGGFTGGLFAAAYQSSIANAFATGAIVNADSTFAGFAGDSTESTITSGYWDTETSGMTTGVSSGSSAGTTGLTTAQLQAALPPGFPSTLWGISPTRSYPYLKGLDFISPLATLVVNSDIYTFLPLSQLDQWNYIGATDHIDQASLAAAYTMITRAIGETRGLPKLANVAIDRFFWNDASQTTSWRGPVTKLATLGPVKNIGASADLTQNVIAKMKKGNLVLLRGTYRGASGLAEAWVLGTLFTANGNQAPREVIANDPFTGEQIQIDPVTKMVTSPPDFPLKNFRIKAYQAVTINP